MAYSLGNNGHLHKKEIRKPTASRKEGGQIRSFQHKARNSEDQQAKWHIRGGTQDVKVAGREKISKGERTQRNDSINGV